MLELIVAATLTALATGIGALPVIALGRRAAALQPLLLGIAGGVMAVAAVQGLLLPALDRGTVLEVALGFAVGVAFLLAARRALDGGAGPSIAGAGRISTLVILVLFVHSLPEGFAVGTAYATDPSQLGLFIVIAIALQNIPEGTSVAVPLADEGASGPRMFWLAVLTSAPQPVGAVIAYLLVEAISALLPVSFGFAAGAMLILVAVEVAPEALAGGRGAAVAGGLAGAAVMLAAGLALSV